MHPWGGGGAPTAGGRRSGLDPPERVLWGRLPFTANIGGATVHKSRCRPSGRDDCSTAPIPSPSDVSLSLSLSLGVAHRHRPSVRRRREAGLYCPGRTAVHMSHPHVPPARPRAGPVLPAAPHSQPSAHPRVVVSPRGRGAGHGGGGGGRRRATHPVFLRKSPFFVEKRNSVGNCKTR